MKIFVPTMYKKNVFDISYNKLKKKGIKCIIFDLDNTLALIDEKEVTDDVKKLCHKLKKDFRLVIISNNTKKRIAPYIEEFDIDGVSMAFKPLTKGLKKICKKYNYKKNEMVMVGDQIMTDIISGNRFGIDTILVDPLGKKDLKITGINRKFETLILSKLEERNLLKKGKYYE